MNAPDLQLAVIGNCQIAALVDSQAAIVWCCLPRPDGDPVFSALLTPEGGAATRGVFAVDLAGLAGSSQRYLPNTSILETELTDEHGGRVRITDFCPRHRSRGRMFRPMMLVRIVEPVAGRPIIKLRLRPTSCWGQADSTGCGGSHHLRFAAEDLAYRVTTDCSLTALCEERPQVLDRPMAFLVGPDETVEEAPLALARNFLHATRDYWRDWVRMLAIPFDWQEAVIRAAITLKLCTFEDTGAVLAALTTSIPEAAGSRRNWDYRYCWLRDSYFVVQALNRLGATRTMEAYLHFIDGIVARSPAAGLQPLYGLGGEPTLLEREITTLPGYRGMGPVRVGNSAALQVQHDVYGSVILASTQLFFDARLVSAGDLPLFERLERLGERALAVCELPDAGPWELRNSQAVHSFSAAMSWAGCDRLARIGTHLGRQQAAARWREAANEMQARILERAWNPHRNSLVATFGGTDVDATALLLPELGLIDARDPRFVATLEVIGRELREGDLLYRYRNADDFGRPETAFLICAFWYVNALAASGRIEEARGQFERLLARRTRLGLLGEDMDLRSGELWGNFPQTYSMVGIISSAIRLSRSWEQAL
ncbi:MAG: glycoside hydrolase family 15 protein [Steroidobacteraceae bacterium]